MAQTQADPRLKIKEIHALHGPNIWSNFPVLESWIDVGVLNDVSSDSVEGFNTRLRSWLPSMVEHRCSVGERGGFFQRLERGTYPAHIMEHVAIELQCLAGSVVGFGKARAMNAPGLYRVIVRFDDEAVGRSALSEARNLLLAAYDDRPFDVSGAVERIRAHAVPGSLDRTTRFIKRAARAAGVPVLPLTSDGMLQLGHGARLRRLRTVGVVTHETSAVAEEIGHDRELYRPELSKIGVPVPEWTRVSSAEEAWEAAQDIGLPVLVKPLYRDSDPNYFRPLADRDAVLAAFSRAAEVTSHVAVERAGPGSRVLMLVTKTHVLAAQYEGAPIPASSIHPSVTATVTEAVACIGLDVARVSVLARSLTMPLEEQGGVVHAVDPRPTLDEFLVADDEMDRELATRLTHLACSGDMNRRIPIIAATGGSARTHAARLAVDLLGRRGLVVGYARRGYAEVDGRPLPGTWRGLHHPTTALLINPHVEALVAEVGRRDVLCEGLAFDRCDVAIVAELESDAHLPIRDWGFDEPASDLPRAERCLVEVLADGGRALIDAATPDIEVFREFARGECGVYATPLDEATLAAALEAAIVRV